MPRSKKRRSKPHRPREVFAPPIVLGYLHPTGGKEHVEYDLASLIPMQAIENGKAVAQHFDAVCMALREGYLLSTLFEQKGLLQSLCVLGGVGIDQAYLQYVAEEKTHRAHLPPPPYLTEPAHRALDLICDMERKLTGTELAQVTQETIRRKHRLLCYHPDAAWIVNPDDRSTYEAITGPDAGRGLAYVNRYPRTGYLEEVDGQLRWMMPVEDMHAVITEPLLVVLATPKRKTNNRNEKRNDDQNL